MVRKCGRRRLLLHQARVDTKESYETKVALMLLLLQMRRTNKENEERRGDSQRRKKSENTVDRSALFLVALLVLMFAHLINAHANCARHRAVAISFGPTCSDRRWSRRQRQAGSPAHYLKDL